MTYDPRRGESPYLGMDVDDDADQMAPELRRRPAKQPRRTASDVARAVAARGRDVPVTVRRPAGDTVAMDAGNIAAAGGGDTTAMRGVQTPVPRSEMPELGSTAASQPLLRRRTPAPSAPMTTRAPYAVPSPEQQPYHGEDTRYGSERRPSGPLTTLAALSLRLLALVLRLAAIVTSLVVIASAVLTDAHRATLVRILNLTSWMIPSSFAGRFVVETPFGGALRGDLVVVSVTLFVLDWLCLLYATTLRNRRLRGV